MKILILITFLSAVGCQTTKPKIFAENYIEYRDGYKDIFGVYHKPTLEKIGKSKLK